MPPLTSNCASSFLFSQGSRASQFVDSLYDIGSIMAYSHFVLYLTLSCRISFYINNLRLIFSARTIM